MPGHTFHSRTHYWLSGCIAFLLPFKQGVAVLIALLLLNWLVEMDFRNKIRTLFHSPIALLFLSFYLLHAVGILWTTNPSAGFFDLQVKLSLLIFPVIFSTRPLEKHAVDRIFIFFILGCAASCTILFIRAAFSYLLNGENHFLYVEFSYFIHPGYFSMYLNFSLIYLLFYFQPTAWITERIRLLCIALFCITIVLLSSKIGYLTLLLSVSGWVIYTVLKRKKYLHAAIGILLAAGLMITGIKCFPLIAARINTTLQTLTSGNPDKANEESTAVRINIWKAAARLSTEHPVLGQGTGGAQPALMNAYKKEGIKRALDLNLNAHNAYLQVLVSLGFAGLLLLLAALFIPGIIAIKNRNWIYFFFVSLLMFNFIPESSLETQAGTMFYGFFNSLIFFTVRPETTNT